MPAPTLSRFPPVSLRCLALSLSVLAGCGGGQADAASAAATAPAQARGARERDPRLVDVARLVEAGRAQEALDALEPLRAAGLDPLACAELEARALLARGDGVGALRALERGRSGAPDAPDAPDDGGRTEGTLAAVECELFCAMGRPNAAQDAYRRGIAALGRSPELERARGVLAAVTPGGARRAVEALQAARAADPTLRFVDLPLGQAHLLLGRELLASDPRGALSQAEQGLACLPDLGELVDLEAQALEALGGFDEALERLERLDRLGRQDLASGQRRALLHKRAATAALLGGRREEALEHFRAARALGLDDGELGFGVSALADAAEEAVDAGYALLSAELLDEAEEAFVRALAFEPTNLEARHYLGVTRFRAGRYVEAALVWDELLQRAEREDLELPDPVHLDLARAWRMAGEPERARAVLDAYLAREPAGSWAAETREMLAKLGE